MGLFLEVLNAFDTPAAPRSVCQELGCTHLCLPAEAETRTTIAFPQLRRWVRGTVPTGAVGGKRLLNFWTRRFHFLYDKVWREDILAHAYSRCRANGGAPGVDGVTFSRIEVYGMERWLDELREEIFGHDGK